MKIAVSLFEDSSSSLPEHLIHFPIHQNFISKSNVYWSHSNNPLYITLNVNSAKKTPKIVHQFYHGFTYIKYGWENLFMSLLASIFKKLLLHSLKAQHFISTLITEA